MKQSEQFLRRVVRMTCDGLAAGVGLDFAAADFTICKSRLDIVPIPLPRGAVARARAAAAAPFTICKSRSDIVPIPLPREAFAGAALGAAAGRPPLGFVVPSRAKSLSASSLRPARRAAAAAFLCAPISAFMTFGSARRRLGAP